MTLKRFLLDEIERNKNLAVERLKTGQLDQPNYYAHCLLLQFMENVEGAIKDYEGGAEDDGE